MPSAAVLLLCWNHERYLEQCIGSLAAQTRRDFEVVFLDNVSTDRSFELAQSLLRDSGLPFRAERNEQPKGIAANFNRLFAGSTAPLLCPLSTDDWYGERYIESMIEASAAHPQAGLLYPRGFSYFEDEDRYEEADPATQLSGRVLMPLLEGKAPFFFVGCCYPRWLMEELGGWDESMRVEDMDFFIRLTSRHPIQRVPEAAAYYRRFHGTASSNLPFMIAGWEELYRKHRGLDAYDMRAWLAEMYRSYAARYCDDGQPAEGARLLAKAMGMKPLKAANFRTMLYLARVAVAGKRAEPPRVR